jgi:hypothetical protein
MFDKQMNDFNFSPYYCLRFGKFQPKSQNDELTINRIIFWKHRRTNRKLSHCGFVLMGSTEN